MKLPLAFNMVLGVFSGGSPQDHCSQADSFSHIFFILQMPCPSPYPNMEVGFFLPIFGYTGFWERYR